MYDFNLQLIYDKSKPAKTFTAGYVFYNIIYSHEYPGYLPILFMSDLEGYDMNQEAKFNVHISLTNAFIEVK